MQILTELYTEYPFSGHGQAMHPQLHHTAGADPGSYEAIKAALLDCIWTAGLSHGQMDVNAVYFALHGLSAAAGSVTAMTSTAWSGFAQENHRADMRHFIWSKPCLEQAKRTKLEKVVSIVCKYVSVSVCLTKALHASMHSEHPQTVVPYVTMLFCLSLHVVCKHNGMRQTPVKCMARQPVLTSCISGMSLTCCHYEGT